jgi:hypothetical protein
MNARWIRAAACGLGVAGFAGLAGGAAGVRVAAQQTAAPKYLPVTPMAPLFFREPWRQSRPMDASTAFRPEAGITPAAVTNADLELHLYDPGAKNVPAYLKNPPPGSMPVDWDGPSCIQLGGYNQNPPPAQVVAGQPSDPPNLWTGVCQTAVAVTLRHKASFVNLTTPGSRIKWVTRTSGFHVVRPVLKLADGSFVVGDAADGGQSANSQLFVESEVALGNVRWLSLDIARVVTRGDKWVQPDLSKVDEIGFADLYPGSGHGWGGFVNVGRIEVFGSPVSR